MPQPPANEIASKSATELAGLLAVGRLSATEVLEAHLEVIVDRNPTIAAVCTLSEREARDEAKKADDAFANGYRLGSLHGLPIMHKDLFETRNVLTTYGSPTHADYVPSFDSTIVRRCRAAGAVMVGKTNTPQFATGGHTANPLFGTTLNPWDESLTAGGSSGGSAAALASRMTPLATGSDMAGSLRAPAAFCGVVGMRPSSGRVPNWPEPAGEVPFAVAGPMARTVEDVALLMSVISGPDPRVHLNLEPQAGSFWPIAERPRTARVAWCRSLTCSTVAPEIAAVLELVPQLLSSADVKVEEDRPDLAGARECFEALRGYQYALNYQHLLTDSRHLLGPLVVANIEAGLAVSEDDRRRAWLMRSELIVKAQDFFTEYDALVLPGATVLPFPASQWTPDGGEQSGGTSYLDWLEPYLTLTVVGLPVVVVPVGYTAAGLPVAVQVVAGPGCDETALQYASLVEQLVPAAGLRADVVSDGSHA